MSRFTVIGMAEGGSTPAGRVFVAVVEAQDAVQAAVRTIAVIPHAKSTTMVFAGEHRPAWLCDEQGIEALLAYRDQHPDEFEEPDGTTASVPAARLDC